MNFLGYDSWFDNAFKVVLRNRLYTIKTALNVLYQQAGHNIVETGCLTYWPDQGSGSSTFVFGAFLQKYGGHLTTIDIDPTFMAKCEYYTKEFADNITYFAEDSLIAIPKLTEPIDLLYLDSYNVPEEGRAGDASPGQEHQLKEFKAAEHLLHKGSVILLDDNAHTNGGKTKLTKIYLKENGYKVILDIEQSLWMK